MLPHSAIKNGSYMRTRRSKFSREIGLSYTCPGMGADGQYILLRKVVDYLLRTLSWPATPHCIRRVICICAYTQMIRINARSIMTKMSDDHSIWDRSFENPIALAMHLPSRTGAIAVLV